MNPEINKLRTLADNMGAKLLPVMESYQNKVKEFQLASGQPVDLKRELTKEELDFRDDLLREEIRELREAIVDNNRVEILDALCDIKYVNDGTANMMGKIQSDSDLESTYNIFTETLQRNLEGLDTVGVADVSLVNLIVYELAYLFNFSLENFKAALDRVHASNMSKFCYDTKTAERTQEFYAKQGIETYVQPREKKTVVYRKGDGKVLKSVEYHPVI